ncbi:phthiocerol/phthiodiolone dimycocerosyl transferase family protein [Amycolatopsis sp. CA-126428]|uniref:phthiocerol/phthiodiolone dimycocerosyl transferase family protein n=1 Tax=Amycolatopsis sp. CA-126428 TaxID=2073158 RepID=UPI000CD21C3A|nr:short-chain dehydrogenase [Amycolatopsis sp. CA-126428]
MGEVRRELSPMERWYWVCDQISPLNVVARVRVRGVCTPVDLERAAAMLVGEHPLLRVAVAGQDGARPRFAGAANPRIPVRAVDAEPSDVDRWHREVGAVELTSSLDWHTGPLARLADIAYGRGTAEECHDLVLTVSHIVADGTTALGLLRRLVELAARPPLEPPPSRPALPPPEAMLPRRVNRLPRAAHLVAAMLADSVATAVARPRRFVPDTPVPPHRRRTGLVHRELTAAQLAELTARCRREGVTVHSALTAAMAIAVSGTVPARTRVTIGSPVDFRAELDPPVAPDDAGAYVATVPSHVAVAGGGDLWDVARGAFRDLRRRTRFRQHLALVSLLRFMSPRSVATSARAVAVVDRVGPGNVCLSNIGRYDFPARAGEWELSGAQFIAGVSVSGYLVATVNTSHGVLQWNFTYIDGAITGARAEQIADRALRALLSGLRRTGDAVRAGTRG